MEVKYASQSLAVFSALTVALKDAPLRTVMGSEGNGISSEVEKLIDQSISIPRFFSGNLGPESLNVAMATGIIISEIKGIQNSEKFKNILNTLPEGFII